MVTDLDAPSTALYVTAEDLLKAHPHRLPPRPGVGLRPRISDAEIITLAVMESVLGYASQRRWIRCARTHLLDMFPMLPGQSG